MLTVGAIVFITTKSNYLKNKKAFGGQPTARIGTEIISPFDSRMNDLKMTMTTYCTIADLEICYGWGGGP